MVKHVRQLNGASVSDEDVEKESDREYSFTVQFFSYMF